VLNALPLGAVLAHNLVAALLLATLVATNVRLRAAQASGGAVATTGAGAAA
jgi:heme A synthase